MSQVSILGIHISTYSLGEAIEACVLRLNAVEKGYVCFANVHSVTESLENENLKSALNRAYLSLADGMPLVWVSRFKKKPIGSRVSGPDFMPPLIDKTKSFRHGFVGSTPEICQKLVKKFDVNGSYVCPPFRPFNPENVKGDLSYLSRDRLPEIIWVGLGAPKQELWMQEASRLYPDTLFFGVGAAFDFLSGNKMRAPEWMRVSGLEWFYRLLQEPSRLWKRYLVTNTKFIFRAFVEVVFQWGRSK